MTWDERASVYAGAACAWRGSTSAYRRAARQRPLVGDAHAAGFSGGGPHARAQLAAGLALAVDQQTGLEVILRHRMVTRGGQHFLNRKPVDLVKLCVGINNLSKCDSFVHRRERGVLGA